MNILHGLAHFWGDICPDLAVPFLAAADDFLDGGVLLRCEFERVVEMFDILPGAPGHGRPFASAGLFPQMEDENSADVRSQRDLPEARRSKHPRQKSPRQPI